MSKEQEQSLGKEKDEKLRIPMSDSHGHLWRGGPLPISPRQGAEGLGGFKRVATMHQEANLDLWPSGSPKNNSKSPKARKQRRGRPEQRQQVG